MKFAYLPPLNAPVKIDKDSKYMSTKIGDGRLIVVYTRWQCYSDVHLIDTHTGERVKVEFETIGGIS